jgi:hypothetical protein
VAKNYVNNGPIVIRSGPQKGTYATGEYEGTLAHLSAGQIALLVTRGVVSEKAAEKTAKVVKNDNDK